MFCCAKVGLFVFTRSSPSKSVVGLHSIRATLIGSATNWEWNLIYLTLNRSQNGFARLEIITFGLSESDAEQLNCIQDNFWKILN